MLGQIILILSTSYLIGAIPVGYLLVKIIKGVDVRTIGSGRVGTTNTVRAAGPLAGIFTAILDAGKGILVAYIAHLILPGSVWMKVIAVILAVVGQIFSIFLIERTQEGKIRLHGGAGGATTLGGAIALWPVIFVIVLPLVLLVYMGIGYASVTTISIAFFSLVVFGYNAAQGLGPWEYLFYGVATLIIVIYTLRPNLQRLIAGTERAVGIRAYLRKRAQSAMNAQNK
ncbi:MAG: glycerol-3-phosphate acyltransferase [Anaerolineaceae bacterium]